VTEDFLAGAIVMGFAIAALYFVRFWRRTREALFLAFAAAFLLLSATQALLTLADVAVEERSWLYLLRLAAFLLILAALWWQNRRRARS
jgi:zinc transporter ZupT